MMENNKIYLVRTSSGSYEDWSNIIIYVTNDFDKATKVARENHNEIMGWKNKMEIPYDTFCDLVDRYFTLLNNEEFYDWKGYTKEQWEQSYNVYTEYEWYEYNSTDVEEFQTDTKNLEHKILVTFENENNGTTEYED
jgi:hypothetical protein